MELGLPAEPKLIKKHGRNVVVSVLMKEYGRQSVQCRSPDKGKAGAEGESQMFNQAFAFARSTNLQDADSGLAADAWVSFDHPLDSNGNVGEERHDRTAVALTVPEAKRNGNRLRVEMVQRSTARLGVG